VGGISQPSDLAALFATEMGDWLGPLGIFNDERCVLESPTLLESLPFQRDSLDQW
jgi:hypothetical protein